MTTKDHDTDPSTPSARRPLKARGSTTSPAPPAVATDPGLAPPPQESAPPAAPLGIRVPPPSVRPPPPTGGAAAPPPEAAVSPKKDSVELLLEGMAEQRLDRSRTMPQTDGQAAASYHAEHNVHAPGRPAGASEPKVLFEQPPTPVTVRLVRSVAPAAEGASDPTVVTPSYTVRRMFIALGAGVAVVIVIFIALQMAAPAEPAVPSVHMAVGTVSASPPPVSPRIVTVAVAPAAPVAPPSAPEAPAPVAPAVSASVPAVPARAAPRRRTKPAPPSGGDLGEFKTTY